MCEYNLGHFFKERGQKYELILKNVKVEFEFALRVGVGDINECSIKKSNLGHFFKKRGKNNKNLSLY